MNNSRITLSSNNSIILVSKIDRLVTRRKILIPITKDIYDDIASTSEALRKAVQAGEPVKANSFNNTKYTIGDIEISHRDLHIVGSKDYLTDNNIFKTKDRIESLFEGESKWLPAGYRMSDNTAKSNNGKVAAISEYSDPHKIFEYYRGYIGNPDYFIVYMIAVR